MATLKSKSETPQPKNDASIEIPDTPPASSDPGVSVESLPKIVVCFDINTLSHRKLKAIASDLKLSGYSHMTKAELCQALLAL
ncbi:MAG: hypothetical protein JOZ78_21610 [Chroococcidiopsidaceae cyanobacterium CP_BM_ER_R8_30]|nr:hypothetical protein [Chroococcidiopsidaceae cyanobacterium CP_BM_ER_R8_30]